jgi:hypothetical protein
METLVLPKEVLGAKFIFEKLSKQSGCYDGSKFGVYGKDTGLKSGCYSNKLTTRITSWLPYDVITTPTFQAGMCLHIWCSKYDRNRGAWHAFIDKRTGGCKTCLRKLLTGHVSRLNHKQHAWTQTLNQVRNSSGSWGWPSNDNQA